MADDIDRANDLIDNELSLAVNKIRKNASQSSSGSKQCQECGERMPAGRRRLGFTLCVPCAQDKERKGRLFAN